MTVRSDVTAVNLRCEYLRDPVGIDVLEPRLSWALVSNERGQRQTAYRVLVASSLEMLAGDGGDLWDSNQVESDQSAHVCYAGKRLASGQRCFWKVKVRDKDGHASAWSEAARFEMGLLDPEDWQGEWISAATEIPDAVPPAPHLRGEFAVDRPVRSARATICGLGYYELSINGRKVGDHVLDPAFTRYDRRALTVTHDITSLLEEGANAVGVILGNGIYNQSAQDAWYFERSPWRDTPRLLFEARIEYEDGSMTTLSSDGTWRTAPGPITFDGTRNGEYYDARREMPGWDAPGFDDTGWAPVYVVDAPGGRLKAQTMPPIKVTETITPASVWEAAEGIYVFDIGRNIAGWAQLRVSGPAGTEVTMRYGEKLDERGRLDQSELAQHVYSGEFQTDRYTLKGDGEEVFEPHFTYHGFQYVEVTGFSGRPTVESLRGRVVHTAFEPAGSFECSNELLNQIQSCTLRSYVGNFHGYPTDCPQREKNGWTGDALLAAETGLYNYQAQTGYSKWIDDIGDEQREGGELPGIVPTSGWGYDWGNGPCWDSAFVLIPWYLYLYKGDTAILQSHYERMKRYVDYLTGKSFRNLVSLGLGDWVPPFGTASDYTAPLTLLASSYYYVDADTVSKIATILGKDADARKYSRLAVKIGKAFNRFLFDKTSGFYTNGSQTAQATALFQGLVQPRQQRKVLRRLIAEIKQFKWRLNVGIHGAKFVMNALTDNDRVDVGYRLATQRVYPSWGYWIDQGATTLWENWNGYSSHNHIMFGDISAWFYKALAGIRVDPERPGFKRVIIAPTPVEGLDWVRAEHESMYGRIRSAWEQGDGQFRLDVSIPPNTTGLVFMPSSDPDSVCEGGRPAAEAEGVTLVRTEKGKTVLEIGSGNYAFACAIG